MPFVLCTHCDQVFHEEHESRFYFCRCGQPLTDGDEISELAVHRSTRVATARFSRSGIAVELSFPSLKQL